MNVTNTAVLGAPPIPRERIWSGARVLTLQWHRLALGGILLLAALLNFWQLDSIGYANSYYAAAVKSMLQNWHNFFFVSFDPGGYVTIDKPPLGFWIQTASAKLFGYNGVSLLLPEALAGVLSVAVLYRLVAQVWGHGTGLLAALFLAVTPVSVITSRNNTIDSLLVLTVLLAAWAVTRAAESGKLRWLLLCAVLVGLGFNIKMLEAYLVVPAFGLVYLLGARARWRTRLGHLALAVVTLLTVSLSWAIAVDLTPASARPYVGSSGTNSELNLALGYNGLQRLTGTLFGHASSTSGTPGGGAGGGNALFNGGPAGLFRLLGTTLGGQVSWLLILALLGLSVAARSVPWRRLDARGRSLILWGSWLLMAGAFFSVAEFFHPYYTVMLAPAIAAPAAIGVTVLWRAYRGPGVRGWLLPLVLLDTGAVQAYILRDYPAWSHWLTPLVVSTCLLAALTLAVARLRNHRMTWLTMAAAGLAVTSLLAAPTTWAAYSVIHGTNSSIPTAGPSAQTNASFGGGPGGFGGAGGPSNPMGSGTGQPNGAPPAGSPMFGGSTSGTASSGTPAAGGTAATKSIASKGGSTGAGGTGVPRGGMAGGQVDTALVRYLEAHQGTARYLVATASSQSLLNNHHHGQAGDGLGWIQRQRYDPYHHATGGARRQQHRALLPGPVRRYGRRQHPDAMGGSTWKDRAGQPVRYLLNGDDRRVRPVGNALLRQQRRRKQIVRRRRGLHDPTVRRSMGQAPDLPHPTTKGNTKMSVPCEDPDLHDNERGTREQRGWPTPRAQVRTPAVAPAPSQRRQAVEHHLSATADRSPPDFRSTNEPDGLAADAGRASSTPASAWHEPANASPPVEVPVEARHERRRVAKAVAHTIVESRAARVGVAILSHLLPPPRVQLCRHEVALLTLRSPVAVRAPIAAEERLSAGTVVVRPPSVATLAEAGGPGSR